MTRRLLAVLLAVSALGHPAAAAEPILGDWLIPNGEIATAKACGPSFCIIAASGKYKGRQVARVSGTAPLYLGEVIDPTTGKSYEGSAKVEGASLTLKGCAFKIVCRSHVWKRR
ncbi:DUF2147 domain-containing protein [Aureimonas endophytica]|nr:DUF2147 domain-containing protein [Aureimonas endophytica]